MVDMAQDLLAVHNKVNHSGLTAHEQDGLFPNARSEVQDAVNGDHVGSYPVADPFFFHHLKTNQLLMIVGETRKQLSEEFRGTSNTLK